LLKDYLGILERDLKKIYMNISDLFKTYYSTFLYSDIKKILLIILINNLNQNYKYNI